MSFKLRQARRLAEIRKARERPYLCDICGKRYSQSQGVSRHRQAEHNPHSCLYCDFKWSRPYQYRIHLKRLHPDVDPDDVLGKSAESRRRSTIIGRDLPLPPPSIEPDGPGRRNRAESRPLTLPRVPPPAVPNVTHDLRPAVLSVSYGHHPEHAELTNTMPTHEDVGGLGFQFPGAADALLSTDDCDQLVNISIPGGQKLLA